MRDIQKYLDYACLFTVISLTLIKIYEAEYEMANIYGVMFIWILRTVLLEKYWQKKN